MESPKRLLRYFGDKFNILGHNGMVKLFKRITNLYKSIYLFEFYGIMPKVQEQSGFFGVAICFMPFKVDTANRNFLMNIPEAWLKTHNALPKAQDNAWVCIMFF